MERNRKQKLLMIIALVLSIASLSIGFAAFSTTLNISSSASVTPNSDTFSVKFSTSQNSLVVGAVTPSSKTSGIITTDGVIDNSANPTIKGLSATFTSPGQYVEYTFYARNEGEYTAYLNNINFLGSKICPAATGTTASLAQSACESINISVTVGNTTYTETTPITGHTLAKNTGEQIKIKLEYASNGVSADGAFSIKFPDVALVYSTLDDSSMKPKVVRLVSGALDVPGSVVSIGAEKFYVIGKEDGNVKLLAMYNLHVGYIVDENWNQTPLENPTGIQDSDATGILCESEWDSNTCLLPIIGVTPFYSEEYSGCSVPGYEGSIVQSYLNNYALYLEGLGVNTVYARLFTFEELEGLGYSVSGLCSGAHEWVNTTSYWVGIDDGWATFIKANHGVTEDVFREYIGVRPVIEIPLSEF